MLCWSNKKPYNLVGRGSPITPWIFRPVFSYRCVLPVGINFNLTYGLKPQVSGIKIFRQSIFQVEWLIATLIFRTNQLTNLTIVHCNNQILYLFVSGNNSRGLGWKEEYHVYVNTINWGYFQINSYISSWVGRQSCGLLLE